MPAREQPDHQNAAIHAWGLLTTRLNDAVGRARQALAPHDAHLPDGALARLDTLLDEFARRRVRIALYGEVKAGKSTLLNAIAGAELSPVAFEPMTSIPVRVTYGPTTAWHAGGRRVESVADLEPLMRDRSREVDEVVVETNLDLLQLGGQLDLMDTPGVGSETQLDGVTADAVRSLDAVVLVVRYPALFTQYTRRLIDGLRVEIGKLFVVWNIDAASAELTPQERDRHAQTLRAHVAGAHELFPVNARAAFRAALANDNPATAASGLNAFTAALTRFAASSGREHAALREAAKRAQEELAAAQRALRERHGVLERELTEARRRIEARRAAADQEAATERARLAELEAAIARIGQENAANAARLADGLRRQLRAGRRRWVRGGNFAAVEADVEGAVGPYAEQMQGAGRAAHEQLAAAAAKFGITVSSAPRPQTKPSYPDLTTDDRFQRAATGRWRRLRRAVWQRWYLPGLAALERSGIGADVAEQANWLTTVSNDARKQASDTLDTRLQDIARRADADTERIRVETDFSANEAEFGRLNQDLPGVDAQFAAIAGISAEARVLLSSAAYT